MLQSRQRQAQPTPLIKTGPVRRFPVPWRLTSTYTTAPTRLGVKTKPGRPESQQGEAGSGRPSKPGGDKCRFRDSQTRETQQLDSLLGGSSGAYS